MGEKKMVNEAHRGIYNAEKHEIHVNKFVHTASPSKT